jgi:putative SOS response-associated peptidase YedK
VLALVKGRSHLVIITGAADRARGEDFVIPMCARYVITSPPDAIRALFGYSELPNFPPRYNVAPTQPIPIVRLVDGKRSFALVRWGFIPAWVKDPKKFSLLVNARGESLRDKPAFRNAMRRRRCLVPADGFYDWGGTPRRPYFVRTKNAGGPIAFAGLWETWTGPNGEEVDTATIVTTAANRTLAPIHDRMPVIVAPEAFNLWLDCAEVDAATAAALIAPASDALLECYEISPAVNRVANDDARLIEPAGSAKLEGYEAAQEVESAKRKKRNEQMSLF